MLLLPESSRAARAERASALSDRFRAQLTSPRPARPAGMIGLEHEFTLRTGVRVLDFRNLIHTLDVPGLRVDPTDPDAYRCAWGGTITADGQEAEIATPPVPVVAGFSRALEAWSDRGRDSLGSVLPPSVQVAGYSTHLNIEIPDGLNDRVCDAMIRRFVPALMLLTEREDSPGVLVRPRPGRLEVGTEFTDGSALRAAAVLLAGGVRALCDAIGGSNRALPAPLRVRVLPASERFGWFVPTDAFGPRLGIGEGERGLRGDGGRVRARVQLEEAFGCALDALGSDVDARDLEAVATALTDGPSLPSGVVRGGDGPAPSPFATVPRPPVRPGFDVRPAAVTWDLCVFQVKRRRRSALASVPRDSLPSFLRLLEQGELDGVLEAYLAVRSQDRVLGDREAAANPGLFDHAGAPADVLPAEREPIVPGGVQGDRPGKRHRDEHDDEPSRSRPRRPRPRWQIAAAAGAALVLVAGSAFALTRHKHLLPVASPAPTVATAPSIGPPLTDPVSLATARLEGSWAVPDWGSENWLFAPACETGPCDGTVDFTTYSGPQQPDVNEVAMTYTGAAYSWAATTRGYCRRNGKNGKEQYLSSAAVFQQTFTVTVTEARMIDGVLRATAMDWTSEGTSKAVDAAAEAWGCPASPVSSSGVGTLAG